MARRAAVGTRGKQSGGSVANVTHALKGSGFQAEKSDLLDRAKQNHCRARDIVGAMPYQGYRIMADVMKGFSKAY